MDSKKEVTDSYSAYAQKWAEHMRSGHNLAHEYLEKPAMYGKLPNLQGRDVLCIGCGTGEECDYIHSLGVRRVSGIDLSPGLIEYAHKSYPTLDFKVMDMENLDFPDESFDFIYSSLVMHYVESLKPTLEHVYRTLKKGGTFLFSTHHPATFGAGRSRNEHERHSLLGYKKYYDTGGCEVFGDYLNTRRINDTWFGDFQVSYMHRSMADILKDILASRLEIIDFLEPKPADAAKDVNLAFWEIHQKIPAFMIFELRKR